LPEKIIEACKQTGAEAVHPGYGFLSERAGFAEALAKAGIVFIGPPPKAIAAMGDKIESKRLAQKAGVSVVPGFVGEIADARHAAKIAKEVGYPVMMKASAGGGGKGMRLAWTEKELHESFEAVRGEARSSFGDDRLFIEKFIESPRHIEIQLLGDQHGTLLYLGERECSIQRRHQKVVEEAPSPFVTPEMREAMGEQAVGLGKAVGYFSAGTVEFIAGADRSFYFLEMNTRLQVEHPVTECVTGLDLVEQMIRVAAGEKLALTQADVALDGWAIETRVYAEDPYRSFVPAIGRLTRYREPAQEDGVRVDSGVTEGSEISIYYDPMIAKLVTHGRSREEATDKQIAALDRYLIRGLGHNLHFLSSVMQHPRFRAGDLSTGFIAEEYQGGFQGAPLTAQKRADLVIAAAVLNVIEVERANRIDGKLNGHGADFGTEWTVVLDKEAHPVAVTRPGNLYEVRNETGDHQVAVRWSPGDPIAELEIDGHARVVELERTTLGWRMSLAGAAHDVAVHTPRRYALSKVMIEKPAPDLSRFLLCPMPGLVVSIDVTEGRTVEAGQPLAVVEAMKMQNILRAERRAVVKSIPVKQGDSLAVGAVIMEFA
jgi:propionyl-CoA carboxylase alpha chain